MKDKQKYWEFVKNAAWTIGILIFISIVSNLLVAWIGNHRIQAYEMAKDRALNSGECLITTIEIEPGRMGGSDRGRWERKNNQIHAWINFGYNDSFMGVKYQKDSVFELFLDPVTGKGSWLQTVPETYGEIVGAKVPGSDVWEIARRNSDGRWVEKFTFTPL